MKPGGDCDTVGEVTAGVFQGQQHFESGRMSHGRNLPVCTFTSATIWENEQK